MPRDRRNRHPVVFDELPICLVDQFDAVITNLGACLHEALWREVATHVAPPRCRLLNLPHCILFSTVCGDAPSIAEVLLMCQSFSVAALRAMLTHHRSHLRRALVVVACARHENEN